MSRPLAQIFTINEPVGGATSIAIESVWLYFKSIGTINGVDVQIREVANGVPTLNIVKGSRNTVKVGDKYANGATILKASSDGTAYSGFIFEKPIRLSTQKQYALCVLPHGGDPKYQCWGAKLNDIDTRSKAPIQFNQSVGPLFFYSNDKTQTSTTNQAIKFLIRKAECSNSRHYLDNYGHNDEHIMVNDLSNSFVTDEMCFMSEATLNLASVSLNSNTGAFINGEAFYQSNGTANVVKGHIYSANSQTLLLNEITGKVSNAYLIRGVSSNSSANIAIVNTSVICSNTSNSITLPFTGNSTSTLFYANQSVYLTSADGLTSEVFIVSAVNADNRTLRLFTNPTFSDSNAEVGIVRGDNLALRATWGGYDGVKMNNFMVTFNDSTANTEIESNFHFANSEGAWIFGASSKSRCKSYGTYDLDYHCVVPHISHDRCEENDHRLYFGGFKVVKKWVSDHPESWRNLGTIFGKYRALYWKDGHWEYSYDWDPHYKRLDSLIGDDRSDNFDSLYDLDHKWHFDNECENEYHDSRRSWHSRSHEWIRYGGKRSVWMRHRCKMSNTEVIPEINPEVSYITLTTNLLFKDEDTSGYRLTYSDKNGLFLIGSRVQQDDGANSSFGYVYMIDSNYLYIQNTSGVFKPNLTVYSSDTPESNAMVTGSVIMDERFTANVFPGQSRYMSKAVVLAEGQDAEDIKIYLTAYRPASSNFKIYMKAINGQDHDPYDDRVWSRLVEANSSYSLVSSGTNLNDFVELAFDIPVSSQVFANLDNCGCSNASLTVTVPTSVKFTNGDFIYLTDPSTGAFNVRQIVEVQNNTSLVLTSKPSFSNTANLNIGLIPYLEDATAAFLYDMNGGIMRYSTIDDIYYDSYKKFAIKIVPISDDPVIVPRLADMRCIALQT
jgi:hypothetical protein